jgi:hypothetical protein
MDFGTGRSRLRLCWQFLPSLPERLIMPGSWLRAFDESSDVDRRPSGMKAAFKDAELGQRLKGREGRPAMT